MITVVVETQKVYSHGTDGMPKVEKIQQKFREGANFNKFLKYLPFQGYINDKIRIVKAVDGENEVDKTPYEQKLKEVLIKLNTPEETIQDKYEKEKQRNDELSERLAALEAKFSQPKQELEKEKIEESTFEDLTKAELTELYKEKFGKNPFSGWKKEELMNKLKD